MSTRFSVYRTVRRSTLRIAGSRGGQYAVTCPSPNEIKAIAIQGVTGVASATYLGGTLKYTLKRGADERAVAESVLDVLANFISQ